MKYYIIAGEASGDLHASNLMKALKAKDDTAQFRCWGGDLMEAAGGQLVKHYRELAFMGFWEVAKNIRTILGNFKLCKADILSFAPDVLILVDYPGFNLRMAKWAKTKNLQVFYYISPQVWAWHTSRVHGIKATVDRMFVILPFEKDFYKKYDYAVDFVGHPLLDVIDGNKENSITRKEEFIKNDKKIIALLPGSRRQEISRMLQIMLSLAKRHPEQAFVIGAAPAIPKSFYDKILLENNAPENVSIVQNKTYTLLAQSHAAIVTSGTATLETALHEIPQVVCYYGNKFSYLIARQLVKIDFISLVNLILGKELVKELIQDELTNENLDTAFLELLAPDFRAKQIAGYQELKLKLGKSGASQKCADLMIDYLKQSY